MYSLSVYNVKGQKVQEVFSKNLSSKEYKQSITLHNLASGVYYYELKGEGFRQTRKMLYLK